MTDVLAAEPLVHDLERFDAAEVAARNRALAVMSALPAPGLRIAASLVEPPAGPWILFGSEADAPRLAIPALDGAAFAPADDAALLVALDRLEPVLAAIEAATGLNLDPTDISRRPLEAGIAVALDVARDAETAPSRLVLHVAADAPAAWPAPAIDLSVDGAHLAVPIAGRLVLDAAVVSAARVAALRTGDIVLTAWGPRRPGDARLALPNRHVVGRFDPADRRFTVITLEEDSAMTAPPMEALVQSAEAAAPDTSPIAPADLPVALRVMLGEASLPLSELTGLRPGSTVVLGGSARDTTAVLLAGDHPIATGKLVAVGEAYGVLIEQLAKGA
ncbi:FliM/FliN family flagellar motor switch protein [Caulobacter sp. BK020]|uniref:FliM/FliN family flagellar motor switch protein n=1 Tax=Caulobacter sp. BK020 TaxID=2512117 RepID=UPI00104BCFC1|nr:FliM/FliN family flagellar motor switch protein [Caulobacter sp. BK020]TCS15935.1 flagellar motor switch/type III secretory pathway protein FliN [Caulobacter sp. BK020]